VNALDRWPILGQVFTVMAGLPECTLPHAQWTTGMYQRSQHQPRYRCAIHPAVMATAHIVFGPTPLLPATPPRWLDACHRCYAQLRALGADPDATDPALLSAWYQWRLTHGT
jgi:hypothetical protein